MTIRRQLLNRCCEKAYTLPDLPQQGDRDNLYMKLRRVNSCVGERVRNATVPTRT